MEDKESVILFGREFSKKELLWNGIAFLLIGIAYEVMVVANQLPEGWHENPELLENIEIGWIIPFFLFIISYILIDRSIFGKNVSDIINKYGFLGYIFRKLSLSLSLIFINLILKSLILIAFF